MNDRTASASASTGVPGLDDVLGGGLARGHVFLVEGEPGSGKTTLALQFLIDGAEGGETCLYITLSETETELRAGAASHGWTVPGSVSIYELVPPESLLDADQQQSLLYSSDLELGETTRQIFDAFERLQPTRVVLDSLSEIRLLAQSSLRYRRQILAVKHYFARRGATVLMLDDLTTDHLDKTVHSIAHGVIRLEQDAPSYGPERRRVRVLKYRGTRFRGGYHDLTIETGGVRVFPRLVAAEHRTEFARDPLSSGIPALDGLLGGGIDKGSSTLVIGPAGTGKSLLTALFALAAVRRGEQAALFVFDEEIGLLLKRLDGLGLDVTALRRAGRLLIQQVDSAEVAPGEFAHHVRRLVERDGVGTVVIDSLNGYRAAMLDQNSLVLHLHELLQFLNRQGTTTFTTIAQHGLVGDMKSPVDVSYLADTVVVLRYFEAFGEVRRAISVMKKRTGPHESTIREYRITQGGLTVGEPLRDFQGILKGTPNFVGGGETLLDRSGP